MALGGDFGGAETCAACRKKIANATAVFEALPSDSERDQLRKQVHHFVEKGQAKADGIPESAWDAPENRVRIPTLKHWQITGWYMTKNPDYNFLSPRNYLKGKTWDEKLRVGHKALSRFGVLKR